MFNKTAFSKTAYLALVPALALSAARAHAQFYNLKGASISVGATGPMDRNLTSDATSGTYLVPNSAGGNIFTTVSNQTQQTTDSVGLITSLQFHPKPWAGVEVNYAYRTYSEVYSFNYSSTTTPQSIHVGTDSHEATGAYEFHPKHIPFQPFVNVGGGAVDFVPRSGPNQWRGAGLLEAGFDLPTHNPHFGFRLEGRSLYYRAPNYNDAAISSRSWRATFEPAVSTFYRF